MHQTDLGFDVRLNQGIDGAVETVTEALKTEGFGVLTRIDVQSTLKEKLGEDFRPYLILGACNPTLAHRALNIHPEVGMMLPCNVTVEAAEGGGSLVRIVDPAVMMGVGDLGTDAAMRAVAAEAREKLLRVASNLAQLG